MQIEILSFEQVSVIEPLWKKLNAHHLNISKHFSLQFHSRSFGERLKLLANREKLQVFICRIENRVVGYCLGSTVGTVGEIDSIFVEREFRGAGIGEKLMRAMIEWLDEVGAVQLQVSVVSGNENSYTFYEKFGFFPYYSMLRQRDGELDGDN